MRKFAILLILAVILPSLALAWLVVVSLRDAQFVLERQQAALYQDEAGRVAGAVFAGLTDLQGEFNRLAVGYFASPEAAEFSRFDAWLRQEWRAAQVGFLVGAGGVILSPPPGGAVATEFRSQNAAFLGNREAAEVYSSPVQQATPMEGRAAPQTKQVLRNIVPLKKGGIEPAPPVPAEELSKAVAMETEFQQVVSGSGEGMFSRFQQDQLALMFWRRIPDRQDVVAGVQIARAALVETLASPIRRAGNDAVCVALLDERARPVALSRPGFQADWKRPFVAAEIGEVLPRWEVAVYLVDPASLERAATRTRLLVGVLVVLLLLAIGTGSALLVADRLRQIRLARQKSDFVSNVSHELKTPLTAIRMFSDLLLEKASADDEKKLRYLGIISSETARLTRLINNVLDFSRSERGGQKLRKHPLDLRELLEETLAPFRPGLETAGFHITTDFPDDPVTVDADPDALASVLVNLISNAEKYSPDVREIGFHIWREGDASVFLAVEDRGRGIPPGQEEKIFEEFHRALDTLDEGISGSGLGLTITRRVVEAHGGSIRCCNREGGGATFVVQLPVSHRL